MLLINRQGHLFVVVFSTLKKIRYKNEFVKKNYTNEKLILDKWCDFCEFGDLDDINNK